LALLASDELRLLYAVLLNVLVLATAWRLARRWEPDDVLRAAADAGLLFYLVQYLAVAIPGLIGAIHPLTIALVAVLLSSAMAVGGVRRRKIALDPPPSMSRASIIAITASSLFVLSYFATLVWHQRQLPVISNDALTYQLPAAVQWLQTGRIGLYEAWYYNPANSFSPLAGSTFIAWLIAPAGNDVLARFVEVGPLILLFVATINLCRAAGMTITAASILAAAIVLLRPFASQTILAKDDLFVAAFFAVLIDAMRRLRLEQRVGAWRIGIALGLLLATKYTVLLSMPILLLMLGRGWTWRRFAVAAGAVIALAGPWYVRNLILTGNPIYPTAVTIAGRTIFPGMLHVTRSELLKSFAGVWDVFTGKYYSVPRLFDVSLPRLQFRFGLAQILIFGWLAAGVLSLRRAASDRLTRTALMGPIIGVGLFVLAAPYGEMRFTYPSLLLIGVAGAIALARVPTKPQAGAAIALACASAATAFRIEWVGYFMLVGALAALAGALVALSRHAARIVAIGTVALTAITGMAVYVQWSAYIDQCDADSAVAWSNPGSYDTLGEVWTYVRTEVRAGAPIAYANTFFTYPLMGYRFDHRVQYAPTRHDLDRFMDMPRIEQTMTGEQIVARVTAMLRENPDREQWLRRLRETGAEYLVLIKLDTSAPTETANPPEARFVAEEPDRFQRVFDNEIGSVFKIVW
jgi:hypothetical protein